MKKLKLVVASITLTLAMSFVALAGEWKQDAAGWWYQNDDGSYISNQWFQDYDGKWFYLNEQGYMLTDGMAPDGRQVGNDGIWVQPETGDTKKSII